MTAVEETGIATRLRPHRFYRPLTRLSRLIKVCLHVGTSNLRDEKPHVHTITCPYYSCPRRDLRKAVDGLVGRVNGKYGKTDYCPIQYVKKKLQHR